MSAIQYQQVTDRIVAMLEAGVAPWRKPWVAGAGPSINGMVRPRRIGGQPYRGVNTVNLWAAAQSRGYASPYWMTYKAARDFGAQVRKGERAELAFFVGQTTRVIENDAGEEEEDTFSFLKSYSVFNAEQIDGLPDRYQGAVPMVPVDDTTGRHAEAEAFVRATGATVRHGGDKAFYSPSGDYVQMPVPSEEQIAAVAARLVQEARRDEVVLDAADMGQTLCECIDRVRADRADAEEGGA